MIHGATQPRLHWDHEKGWLLDVELALSEHQLKRIAEWALPHQKQRLVGLLPGERKDECVRSIQLLQEGKIQQVVVQNLRTDGAIWQSTERMNPSKTFFHN